MVRITSILIVLSTGVSAWGQFSPSCHAPGFTGCGQNPNVVNPPCFYTVPGHISPPPPTPPGVPVLYNSCVPVFAYSGGPGAANPSDPCQRNDNDSTGPYDLGFQFTLFGQTYTRVFVNNNGNLSFTAPVAQSTPTAFGDPTLPPMIAPFWADVDTRIASPLDSAGVLRIGNTVGDLPILPAVFVATWNHVGRYPQQTDRLNTFQVVITDGSNPILPIVPNGNGRRFNLAFLYNDMQWATGDASGGQNGFGGIGGLVGAGLNGAGPSHALHIGQFVQPGVSLAGGGLDWLDWRALYLDVSGIAPVVHVRRRIPDAQLILGMAPTQGWITPTDLLLVTPYSSLASSMLPLVGGVSEHFAIPSDPAFMGATIYLQVGFLEPSEFPEDPLQLSNGLAVVLGVGSQAYGQSGSPMTITLFDSPTLGGQVRIYYTVPGL